MNLNTDKIVLKKTPWSLFDVNRETGFFGVDAGPEPDIAEATGMPADLCSGDVSVYVRFNVPGRMAALDIASFWKRDGEPFPRFVSYTHVCSPAESDILLEKLDAYLKETVGMTAEEYLKCEDGGETDTASPAVKGQSVFTA